MVDLYEVIKGPHLTEKATILKDICRQIVFRVDPRATKIDIKRAVETIFKTKVVKVRTVNVRGKRKRFGRIVGKRPDWKKAIVTISAGEDLEKFSGV
ncbi:MAG: 50S ribosomal protein L23 [Deltaproteobacteria bacterium]|nr:MAG: 50S ribosomal protein L23 [Deltaproteobacteria bacterium]